MTQLVFQLRRLPTVRGLLLMLLFAPTSFLNAAGATEETAPHWTAMWIQPSTIRLAKTKAGADQPAANQWFCFRKSFDLKDVPQDGRLRIACDSKYWLWINGEVTVREGQLKRGPTPSSTYYDVVDVTEHLRPGENTVAFLLWYYGKHGFSHNSSGQPGLLCQADGFTLNSDETWHGLIHPAYGETGKPHPNYRLPESNVRFDARADQLGWTTPEFDDSQWPLVKQLDEAGAKPWGELHERPVPQWQDSEFLEYESKTAEVNDSGLRLMTAKLPYNAQVTPYLKIDSPAGLVIDIRTDNYRGGSEPNVRAEYVTRAGVQEFEAPGWMNGHSVEYRIPQGVEVLDLKYRETGYDTDFAGAFECDDEFLNRLWKKAQRTLYVNMRDTYFDCPGRERAQWWGDVTLLLTESFYALDRRADRLSRKGILELAAWHRDDGTLYSPVPSGNWGNELPMQMLASVGRYGFWAYYQHSGDRATIERVYPVVRRYVLDVWSIDDDGLVVQRKGGWTWGDWGKHKDLPLLYNGWYYLALDGLSKMAALVEDQPTRQEAESRMTSIRNSFDKRFWRGTEYRSDGYEGLTDDRGQALAVVAGLAGPDRYEAINAIFARTQHASPYMEKYVLEALYQMGFADEAVERMKQRFAKMVDSPLSTLWEGWGIGKAGFGGGSYNHGWSGGPLILLSQRAAGISPLEPGYRRFQVKPQLGPLESVTAKMQSVAGEITVRILRSDSEMDVVVQVPENTIAEIQLPDPFANDISLNGKPIQREPSSNAIELQAGRWKVVGAK